MSNVDTQLGFDVSKSSDWNEAIGDSIQASSEHAREIADAAASMGQQEGAQGLDSVLAAQTAAKNIPPAPSSGVGEGSGKTGMGNAAKIGIAVGVVVVIGVAIFLIKKAKK